MIIFQNTEQWSEMKNRVCSSVFSDVQISTEKKFSRELLSVKFYPMNVFCSHA